MAVRCHFMPHFIVLQGRDRMALRKAADQLVPALKALGPPTVGEAEDDVRDLVSFVSSRAGLYASLDDLEVRVRYQPLDAREILDGALVKVHGSPPQIA